MQSEKDFRDFINKAPIARITDQSGKTTELTGSQVNRYGLEKDIPASEPKNIYKTDKGYSLDPADAPVSISLNEETGNIKITGPKAIYESDMFKNTFNDDVLKEYSQAYKLNKDYKISVTEKNEKTGKEEEREVTIPEYIERLNSSVSNYMENLRRLHSYKEDVLRPKYGNKVDNMSDELLAMAGNSDGKSIYLPDTILNIGSFGKGKNPFLALKDKRTEDGIVSVEDFMDVYTRSNFGRDEMAAVLAAIDGTLRGSDWAINPTYKDEDGIEYTNPNSVEEMAKLIAFKNHIITNNPKSSDAQQMGDYIESFVNNAAYQTTKIFGNLADLGETVVTLGNGRFFNEGIKQMDEAMDYFNENNAMVWDAVTNAQIWGTLGGMALGTWGTGKIMSLPLKGLSAASSAYTAKYLSVASKIGELADAGEKISLGARMAFKAMTLTEKVNLMINSAITGISGIASRNFFTEYIFDTLHDAILYDFGNLREAMTKMAEASEFDQKAGYALTYWMGQYADNAKWWAPMGAGRALIKTAGKTTLGKAANIVLTQYISRAKTAWNNSALGKIGDPIGGNVIAKLQDKLKKAEDAGETAKANRIKRQIEIQNQQRLLADAKEKLGDIKLEWDGVRLTEESAKEWQNAMTSIKAREIAIDLNLKGVDAETRMMLNEIKDPVTGRGTFLYNQLAGANIRATNWYFDLVKLSEGHGLAKAQNSLLNQDVVDYWMGSFKRDIYEGFAKTGTENGAEAQKALEVINENLATLEQRLPEDITDYIKKGIEDKVYQNFYHELNQYGVENKLLVKDTIDSYEANPIWAENGYMPLAHDVELKGRWISDDDKIETIVEQEMDKLTFRAAEGEHFKDPELVRQVRIRHMAQAKVNAEIWKSYSGWGSDATNITKISGEETEYARKVGESYKDLQAKIEKEATESFAENLATTIVRKQKSKPIKNKVVDKELKNTAIASMSPSDIKWYLSQRYTKGKVKVLDSPEGKLTDKVTKENFDEWYDSQSKEVKNYLWSKKEGSSANNPYNGWSEKEIDTEISKTEENTKALSNPGKKVDYLEAEIEAQRMATVEPETELEKAIEKNKSKFNGKTGKNAQKTVTINGREMSVEDVNAVLQGGEPTPTLEDKITAYRNNMTEVPRDDIAINREENKLLKLQEAKNASKVTYDDLQSMVKQGGDAFEDGLERAWLAGDNAFGKSSLLNEATSNMANGNDAFYEGVLATKIKGELKNVKGMDTGVFVDDVIRDCKTYVDKYVSQVLGDKASADAIKALLKNTDGGEAAARYLALKSLLKKNNLNKAKEALANQIGKLDGTGKLLTEDLNLLKDKAGEILETTVKNELNSARLAANTMDPDIIDGKELWDEVADINKRIKEAEDKLGEEYVMYLDDEGRKVYAEVDPAFASLFNYRYKMEKADVTVLAKVNGLMSKAYRYGTTSVNLSSFGNQLFRDFGNALMVGGAWSTIKTNADNLINVFGKNIVEQIKNFEPEEMKRIEDIAEETGRSVESVAVSRELMKGMAKAPSTTERTLYKTFMKEMKGGDVNTTLKKAQTRLQEIIDKYNPEDLLNGKRENYLRNRVYASSLNEAMQQGYSLSQARVFAEFAMNNATTNFTRQLYHLQAIADSTPYFRAAINGHKSFWRMWSLDPVGVSGRIMGGLIIPTMYLTGASLGTEKERALYMNIPEYEKENSLVFAFNGQVVSIPIPQEMGQIVAPFRQFVEYLNGANKNDFWELMMNDLLGFSPIDLKGFSTIDMDQMISDPTIFDRINRGASRLFSTMAPVPLKSAYMLATGTDPYSGKSLRDPSYMYWNDETDSVEVMDYNQNAFARWFGSLFGEGMSPELAEKLVSGLIGSTGSNVLGSLTKLIQENGLSALKELGKGAVSQISKPFDVAEYDYATSVWKRAIRQLTAEKEALLSSEKMKTLNSEYSQTKDPEKRQKILAERQTLTDEFHQKVQSLVERLSSVYKGTFDRQKLAAVINLLNFNSDPGYQSGSQYSSDLASKEFWNGRTAAVHTMERLGITGASDMSIFGYLTVDKDGNPVVKYTSPVAIMDMDYQWDNQDQIHAANIKALVSQNNLYDAHQAITEQINNIYGSKKKLTNQDYANIEAIQINWNAQLAKTIAPYISQMTPEAAINNKEVMNALYPYVEVPGSWEKNNKGKSVSLGDRGNKKKAYYDSWIKSLFSVNDPYKGQY